jgi:tetratricopeptide (TPR) repeat protein
MNLKPLSNFLLFLVAILPCVSAQDKIELINSNEIIIEGIDLFEQEDYRGAIEKFNRIDRNDSLYITALSETGLAYMRLEEYDEAIAILTLAIQSTDQHFPELYINLGSALDDNGDSSAALQVYESGISKYPKNT